MDKISTLNHKHEEMQKKFLAHEKHLESYQAEVKQRTKELQKQLHKQAKHDDKILSHDFKKDQENVQSKTDLHASDKAISKQRSLLRAIEKE